MLRYKNFLTGIAESFQKILKNSCETKVYYNIKKS